MLKTLNSYLPSTCDDFVLDRLPLNEIVRFALVSHDAQGKVRSYMGCHFQLKPLVNPFIAKENIGSFRQMMASSQMVISGSLALQFFARKTWPESDMDLYVDLWMATEVIRWFEDHGYEVISSNEMYLDILALVDPISRTADLKDDLSFKPMAIASYTGMNNIVTYRNTVTRRRVQIMVCHGTPIQIILKFHSTAVVNVITHNCAYCLYPRPTLVKHVGLYQPSLAAYTSLEHIWEKYRNRGWTVIQHLSAEEACGPEALFPFGPRHVGDAQTLKITLDNNYAHEGNNIEHNGWLVSYFGDVVRDITGILCRSRRLAFSYLLWGHQGREVLNAKFEELKLERRKKGMYDEDMGAFFK